MDVNRTKYTSTENDYTPWLSVGKIREDERISFRKKNVLVRRQKYHMNQLIAGELTAVYEEWANDPDEQA
jgi:hypothetical protein